MQIQKIDSSGESKWRYKEFGDELIKTLIEDNVPISESGSKGGYFSKFYYREFWSILSCTNLLGEVSLEKESGYLRNSLEKGIRLNHFHQLRGDTTSRQSRNPENKEWAGGIIQLGIYKREGKQIFTFSGCNEEWDEFISVAESCFDDYLAIKNRGVDRNPLGKISTMFRGRTNMIDATTTQKTKMIEVVDVVIEKEIERVKSGDDGLFS